jgi:hypothetical protein
MDIVARKLNFVQEFLKVSDEEIIGKLENILLSEQKKHINKIDTFTIEEFEKIINASEDDFKYGRTIEAKELFKKTEEWK